MHRRVKPLGMALTGPDYVHGSAGMNERVECRPGFSRAGQGFSQVDCQAFSAQPDGNLGWDIKQSCILWATHTFEEVSAIVADQNDMTTRAHRSGRGPDQLVSLDRGKVNVADQHQVGALDPPGPLGNVGDVPRDAPLHGVTLEPGQLTGSGDGGRREVNSDDAPAEPRQPQRVTSLPACEIDRFADWQSLALLADELVWLDAPDQVGTAVTLVPLRCVHAPRLLLSPVAKSAGDLLGLHSAVSNSEQV